MKHSRTRAKNSALLRQYTVLWGLLCLGCVTPVYADDSSTTCRRFIDNARDQTLSIARDGEKAFLQKHQTLEMLFTADVDIERLARNSAGIYWRQASEMERKTYLDAYQHYLVNYYVGSLDESDLSGIMDIVITKFDTLEPALYHARLKITQTDDDPIHADLHLAEVKKGECKIQDFTVDGVSMVQSQRDEIQSLGKIGGLKLITQRLSSHAKAH